MRASQPLDLARRSACASASKTGGSQSLNLECGALETPGVDAVNVSTTSRSGVEAQPDLDRDAAPRRVFDCSKFVTATELVTMLVEAQQQVVSPANSRSSPASASSPSCA